LRYLVKNINPNITNIIIELSNNFKTINKL